MALPGPATSIACWKSARTSATFEKLLPCWLAVLARRYGGILRPATYCPLLIQFSYLINTLTHLPPHVKVNVIVELWVNLLRVNVLLTTLVVLTSFAVGLDMLQMQAHTMT